MKVFLSTFLALTTILFSTYSFSWCSAFNCGDDSGCGESYCTDCQCADPGVGRNDCIDDRTYCEVFGNIGLR